MTKEELKNATAEELLGIINLATSEHKTGKEFATYGHEFSYSTIVAALKISEMELKIPQMI